MEHILKCLIANSSAIVKDNFSIIVVEDTLNILGSGIIIEGILIERKDFLFRCLQVRSSGEYSTNRIIIAKKRKALVFVRSVVIV